VSRAAWWHCFAGIAGDMALGSLLDAGADFDQVQAGLERLPAKGWHIEVGTVRRGPLVATQVVVQVAPEVDVVPRTWGSVRDMLHQAQGLPRRAVDRALGTFAALARAEGRLHGVPPEEVHFHEVGGLDALVDVVGTCLALESLGIDTVMASPVRLGTGTVDSAHGKLPNPAPAVVELLKGALVEGSEEPFELTTPTGAALLAALSQSFGPLPPLRVTGSGYGAGSRDLAGLPNVVQVVVGELGGPELAGQHQQLVLIETNLDDVTAETSAYTLSRLLEAGALDAWVAPVVGKKGRLAQVLSVLAEPALAPSLSSLVVAETGALGVRQQLVERWALPRQTLEVSVDGEPVRVKAGPHRLKAEHDDCARAAARLGLPVREVARRAEDEARRQAPGRGQEPGRAQEPGPMA